MNIYISGFKSTYELENVARLFFPEARICTDKRRNAISDYIYCRCGTISCVVALKCDGKYTYKRFPKPDGGEYELESSSTRNLYQLLKNTTGIILPWGMLTGVRPVRLIHDLMEKGFTTDQVEDRFLNHYDCSREKFDLIRGISALQKSWLSIVDEKDYSLYIGIPFCPSRCSYCSFVSRTIGSGAKLVQPYVDLLCKEIEAIKHQADQCGLKLKTIYIGGGTPTSLSALQLRQLMTTVAEQFELYGVAEYTVEAGRPDCTDYEKLKIIKELGATRISINPQTFEDEILRGIGRKHCAQDIVDCFTMARQVGHDSINMDLIAGLPNDTFEGFCRSLDKTLELAPDNITVHTLTLKRASNIVIDNDVNNYADVSKMIDYSRERLSEAGYKPYYLYRQKGTLQNLENTGWSKPGKESLYNIYIMEEVHSILSAGAGGSTKLCLPNQNKIQRIFNYKYPTEYIDRFDQVLERKNYIGKFYTDHLSTC